MTRDYEWLDSAVVLMALGIVGFISWSLVFRTVPDNQLAILASIASGVIGTVIGAYAGYRWATSKQASETIANLASKGSPANPQQVEVVNPPDAPVQVSEPMPSGNLEDPA